MVLCPVCASPVPGADLLTGWICPACGHSPESEAGVLLVHPTAERSGFDAESFDHLAGLEPRSFWFRGRNALLVDIVSAFDPPPQRLLEIGCGTGFVLRALHAALPHAQAAGAELFAEGLVHARARMPDLPLLQLDARRLPFREHFDVVGAFDVLEHIDEDERTLASIREALAPGGRVVITVPQHPWLWSAADDYAHHQRRYTRRELRGKLTAAGFEIERLTSFVSFLLPLMLVSRVRDRSAAREYDPVREFQAAERGGNALEGTLTLERRLIDRGVSLPAGGSLLAVGRRVG